MGARELLVQYTCHRNIFLKARGNYALRNVLEILNPKGVLKKILVQDQGGWLRYLDYPQKYGFVVDKLKTDDGVVLLEDLKAKSKEADAIVYEDPAGYIAEQPIKEIYKICSANDCKVVLDVTGSIGWRDKPGQYADFLLCSFGADKPVNLGYGGFISGHENYQGMVEDFEKARERELISRLQELKSRQLFLHNMSRQIKNDLKEFEVIHPEKEGINVMVAFSSVEERQKIIDYCNSKNLEYTLCPRYIRVLRDGISIEVKRLDGFCR